MNSERIKEKLINNIYNVLDYLKTDDYDDTCITHIQMIKDLEECLKMLGEELENE